MRATIFLIFLGVCGCADVTPADEGGTGGEPSAVFRLTVDPATYCDQVGTVSIQLRARYVDCVQQPPAPCTLPTPPQEFRSEVVSCPSGEGEVTLDAVVNRRGRFYVDLIRALDQGTTVEQCGRVDGEVKILVDDPELDANVILDVDLSGAACPEP